MIRTLLVAAVVVAGGVSIAHAEGAIVCGFVSKKNGASIGYNLAVEPGNARAVEIAFYKDNDEIRHLSGGQPYWYISKSPNGGRNYTMAPIPATLYRSHPDRLSASACNLASLIAGTQVSSWTTGRFRDRMASA
ncbi:hypothetical protein PY650_16980 [Rhizobium calliandrae]|uniref:SH3 domain-containing protein n=1 Tax=Rhizobium calliandrae TaxID=1312182 RepID=A0ABT7KH91_9HYPH|nr:hypothetical protein [Rhizobium calliandrae]MDL2407328.1 hypothetical protein [Rhizobium calliandrae]